MLPQKECVCRILFHPPLAPVLHVLLVGCGTKFRLRSIGLHAASGRIVQRELKQGLARTGEFWVDWASSLGTRPLIGLLLHQRFKSV